MSTAKTRPPRLKFKRINVQHLKKGMFVRFTWIDTQSSSGWRFLEDAENLKTDPIESAGWLLSVHKDRIVISNEIGSHRQVFTPCVIPIVTIKNLYIIEGMGFDIDHGPPSEI